MAQGPFNGLIGTSSRPGHTAIVKKVMFKRQIINKKIKIALIIIVIIVVVLGTIGVRHYRFMGTPEYSVGQIKKAIETHNTDLGFKYIDIDAISEGVWTDLKSKFVNDTSGIQGFEALDMMFGFQIAESMKPVVKEQVEKGVESWFAIPTEGETISLKGNFWLNTWQQKNLKKQGGSAYIELPNDARIVFTKKVGERYWIISRIERFANLMPNESQSGSTSTEENGQTEPKKSIIIEKNIGDEIQLTTLKFRVNKVEEKQTISSSYGTPKVAKENTKFVVINLDITNTTNMPFVFTNTNGALLIDDKGRQYEEYDGVIGGIDNYFEQRKLSPDIKENGFFVYEIPKDAINYSLNIGKTGTNEIYKVLLEPIQPSVEKPTTNKSSEVKQELPKIYNLGDRIQIEDKLAIRVHRFSDFDASNLDLYKPKDGYKYVAAEISIVDISNEPISYTSSCFVLIDQENKAQNMTLPLQSPSLDFGTVQPESYTFASVAIGSIFWEVPKNVSGLQLIISFPWTKQRPIVNLGI